MSDFHFQPIFGSLLLAGGLVLGLGALLLVRPVHPHVTPRRRAWLAGLRLLTVLVLAATLLRPTCERTTTKRQSAKLLILVDASRSMQLPAASADKSRWQALTGTLDAAAPGLDRLGRDLQVTGYVFDAELRPVEVEGGRLALPERPEGAVTDVGGPLHAALRAELGQRLAGVVLLSDGAQTAYAPRVEAIEAARELARLEAPLWTVPLGRGGDGEQGRDIAVTYLPEEYSVFVKNDLAVRGTILVRGYANKEIPVELLIEDAAGQVETLRAPPASAAEDGEQVSVEVVYTPAAPGEYKLTLRAAPQPGELIAANNQLSAFLTVLPGGLKALYLEGELRAEQKFLRRAVDASPDIELDFQWIDHRARERWPLDLTPDFGNPAYDVFLLGDLDSSALERRGVQEQNLRLLAQAVGKGKGLMMLGGYHSFGPGGYQATPLADVLPIQMGRLEKQDFGAPLAADLHRPGPLALVPAADHFLTRLAPPAENAAVWRSLPPLDGANKFQGLSPRAQVLLRDDARQPLLVAGEYGAGRVLAFAGDSTWRWTLHGHAVEHKRFWRQAILWLAKRDDLTEDAVWVRLAQRRLRPGMPLSFTAGVRSAAGEDLRDPPLRAELVHPGGRREALRLTGQGTEKRGDFPAPAAPGDYLVEVVYEAPGKPPQSAQTRFLVFDEDLELSRQAADPDHLARLADVTAEWGGRRVAPEQLPELLSKIQPPEMEIEVQEKWELAGEAWEAWLVLLAFVGPLGVEWLLRRRWGMP